MINQFAQFSTRIFLNASGIYFASLFLTKLSYQDKLINLVVASIILALVNAVIRPIVVILSLPAYVLTLGLFSIVINAGMIYLVDLVYKPFDVGGFGTAIIAGLIIGLVNYIITRIFDTLFPEKGIHE